jgi:hypothetical protein
MQNPYGLAAIIQHGDAVSRSVLVVLLIMSVLTWYSIFTRRPNSLWLLGTIGLTAPLVGVFGTVFGTLKALISVGLSGQFSSEVLAGRVGEALLMTAIGLAVAVPAIIGYNVLTRRNPTSSPA